MSRPLSFFLFILTVSLSLAFVLTLPWWRIDVILVLTCLCPLLSVSFFFPLSRSVSLCHSLLNLVRCRSRAASRFLSFSNSLFQLPFLSVVFFPTLSPYFSSLYFSSLSLCVFLARARALLFQDLQRAPWALIAKTV